MFTDLVVGISIDYGSIDKIFFFITLRHKTYYYTVSETRKIRYTV